MTNDSAGDEILFVRETAEGAAIYLMSHDDREARRLVTGTSPRWSPDGSRFAYVVDSEDEETRYCGTSVWVMNSDTGARRRVADVESGLSVCSLAWAPDGVRLAYSTVAEVFVLNTETGATELVSLDVVLDGPMDWSRDGRRLVVSTAFSSKLLDLRTGIEHELGRKPSTGDGRWSPDGERIALARIGPLPLSKRTRRFIVLAEPDGRSPERVTRGGFDSGPAWSPDAKRIYFSRMPATWFDEEADRKQEIYVLDLETRALRRLTRNSVADRLPDIRPEDRALPPVPEPAVGEVLVPDLVGRYVLLEDEERRLGKLGLTLKVVLPLAPEDGVLSVVHEQVPLGGVRAPRGSVVKVSGSDLGLLFTRGVFSGPIWRAHPGCAGARERRVAMYGDLVRRILRRGMARNRVVSLLGEPERSTSRWSDWALGQVTNRSADPIDCIHLRVEFDRRGRATRFYQRLI